LESHGNHLWRDLESLDEVPRQPPTETPHYVYGTEHTLPFQLSRDLGRSGFARVDAIKMTEGAWKGRILARKLITVSGAQKKRADFV
jgi:hypothetical protein